MGMKVVRLPFLSYKAGIDDKYNPSMDIVRSHVFSIPTKHFLTLTSACQAKDSHL